MLLLLLLVVLLLVVLIVLGYPRMSRDRANLRISRDRANIDLQMISHQVQVMVQKGRHTNGRLGITARLTACQTVHISCQHTDGIAPTWPAVQF